MHELTLSRNILEIIKQHASQMSCRVVKKIYLEIGELIAIDQASLQFNFAIVAKGEIAENATLEMVEIKGRAVCDFCKKTVMLKNYFDGCENCGQYSLKIIQGEELRVKSMEVE
ncbi:hydrogenase nickel incorporation protein HypA [Legionella nautarum]|uniref:Hydrogenase maturation factor HypA n=1 Tax=Legionella nautarum TaxID=45070 RepID=A0A0W0WRW0_9GAMM|nr:hydrogenase maturation nickel metallochaperone HypA [Legionella nautarum]KTD35052.1 hydrogenase nickel incorporation protein HypA [Legionella nautarum]